MIFMHWEFKGKVNLIFTYRPFYDIPGTSLSLLLLRLHHEDKFYSPCFTRPHSDVSELNCAVRHIGRSVRDEMFALNVLSQTHLEMDPKILRYKYLE